MVNDNENSLTQSKPLALRLAMLCAVLYLIVLPFGHLTALRSLSLFLATMLTLMVWVREKDLSIPLLGMFGVWLAAACLSLLTTRDLAISLDAIEGEIIRSLLVYVVFFFLAKRADMMPAFGWATALSSLGLGGLAIYVTATHGQWQAGYLPALGDFATTGITIIPCLVTVALLGGKGLRLASLVGLMAILIGGYLTYSRGFWLTSFCSIAAAVIAFSYQQGKLQSKNLILLALAGLTALALAATAARERGISVTRLIDRTAIYLSLIEKIAQNPVTGTGYGIETDRLWYQTTFGVESQITHAHNIVLSYLDQMGFLGLIAILALFFYPAIFFARHMRKQGVTRYWAIAGLAMLTAVCVKNNLDIFFRGANLWLFYAHLGYYVGTIARCK